MKISARDKNSPNSNKAAEISFYSALGAELYLVLQKSLLLRYIINFVLFTPVSSY